MCFEFFCEKEGLDFKGYREQENKKLVRAGSDYELYTSGKTWYFKIAGEDVDKDCIKVPILLPNGEPYWRKELVTDYVCSALDDWYMSYHDFLKLVRKAIQRPSKFVTLKEDGYTWLVLRKVM